MLKRIRSSPVWLILLVLLLVLPAQAQEAQQPVVYGVFFHSPTCPHCRDVITHHWPSIQAEFGDQLVVLFIDASGLRGVEIMQNARTAMQIEARGVPMLIIGDQVMVGSVDIPQRAAQIIRDGLAAGGVPLPPIPGIEELYQAVTERYAQDTTTTPAAVEELSLLERLQADPIANAAAVFVLVLLVFSLLLFLAAYGQSLIQHNQRLLQQIGNSMGRGVLALLALIGLAFAFSLAMGSSGDVPILVLTIALLAVFLVLGIVILRAKQLPSWLLLIAALAGLAVAAYLAYVEVNAVDAVCGTVGNCNTVQQSPYAQVFNIPIGVIGIVGYVSLIVLGALFRINPQRTWLKHVLIAAALFGVAFSAYLTFLEPFVIGASCVWCLTSAVLMLILLWMVVTLDSQLTPRRSMRVRHS